MGIANAVVGLGTQQTQLRESLGPYQTKVSNQNGHLVIDARKGNDQIEVRQKGNTLQATVNGVHYKFDVRKLKSVTIAGGGGNDRIRVDRSVTFPLTLTGGSGNDFIDATNPGHNHVFGNSGRDHIHAKATDHVTTGNVLVHHRDFVRVLHGHGHGTVCVPMASPGQVPPPGQGVTPTTTVSSGTESPPPNTLAITDPLYGEYFGLPTGLNYALIPAEEIERLWNQVMNDSLNQSISQNARQCAANQKDRTKKLELLLQAALASGNIDLAILLVAGLETRQANQVAAGLIDRIRELQQQRGEMADQMGKLGKTQGKEKEDAAEMSKLQTKAGDIGTEISLLQTFLQDVMAQKNEAQMLASNFLKSKHDTAQAIIRNIG